MSKEVTHEREKTHGPYQGCAGRSQQIKDVFRKSANYDKMRNTQRESLDMIANKLGRILTGDKNHPDHWLDISGYAMLVYKDLTEVKEPF